MNIAERILQHRVSVPSQNRSKDFDATLFPDPHSATYFNLPHHPMPKAHPLSNGRSNGIIHSAHFQISEVALEGTTSTHPLAAVPPSNVHSDPKGVSNLVQHQLPALQSPTHSQKGAVPKPPIKVQQSYTPPSYPPNPSQSPVELNDLQQHGPESSPFSAAVRNNRHSAGSAQHLSAQTLVDNTQNLRGHSAPQHPAHRDSRSRGVHRKQPHHGQQRMSRSMSPRIPPQPQFQKSNSHDFVPLPKVPPNNMSLNERAVSSPSKISNPWPPSNGAAHPNADSVSHHDPRRRQSSKPMPISLPPLQSHVVSDELPLGWAKLKDEDGFYYFNVITAEKQRERPLADATEAIGGNLGSIEPSNESNPSPPKKEPNKPLPSPYARDVAPSVTTDDMSVAEIEYRKKNGSVVFAKIMENRDVNKVQTQLIHQENWDMLVDAVYLNLGPSDYVQVFKALRSIAENLFDEDDKYRILYADNKKVQQRILSRIGGYEFLRGLGFREVTKRKLLCEVPDFDVVATAITSINAKLTLLEKNKPLPIIPDVLVERKEPHHAPHEQRPPQEADVEIDGADIDEYKRQQMAVGAVDAVPKVPKAVPPAKREISCDYQDEEDEKTAVLKDTMSLDLNAEGNPGLVMMERRSSDKMYLQRVPSSQIENGRPRTGTQVTSACYSENDDEKVGIVLLPHSGNKVTDLGVIETTVYLQDLEVQRMPPVPMNNVLQKMQSDHSHHSHHSHRSQSHHSGHSQQQMEMERERPREQMSNGHGLEQRAEHRRSGDVQRQKSVPKRRSARKHAHTQDDVSHTQSPKSSSSGRKQKMSMNDVVNIECEINGAYTNTVKRLTLRDLQEEEDVESLFEDDDDVLPRRRANPNGNPFVNGGRHHSAHQYGHRPFPRAQSASSSASSTQSQSLDDFYVNQRPHQHNFGHLSPAQSGGGGGGDEHVLRQNSNPNPVPNRCSQPTFSHQMARSASPRIHGVADPGPFRKAFRSRSNNVNSANYQSPTSPPPQHGPQRRYKHYKQQHSDGNLRLQSMAQKWESPELSKMTAETHQSQGSQRPVGILLPSEQKRNSKKRKKTTQIFRRSVGAFLNAFSARGSGKYSPKDLAKEREEYRRNHPSDEEEDYYVYYGDPQQEEATMTQNALNPEFMASSTLNAHSGPRSPLNGNGNGNGNGMAMGNGNGGLGPGSAFESGPLSPTTTTTHREIEVFFEDETRVIVTAEVSVSAAELVSRALERRGVNTSMAHSFVLCVKDGNAAAEHERLTSIEDAATPIASMATLVNALNLTTPKLVVCFKQGAQ